MFVMAGVLRENSTHSINYLLHVFTKIVLCGIKAGMY